MLGLSLNLRRGEGWNPTRGSIHLAHYPTLHVLQEIFGSTRLKFKHSWVQSALMIGYQRQIDQNWKYCNCWDWAWTWDKVRDETLAEASFISHIIQQCFAEKFWFHKIEIQTILGRFEDAQYRASLQEWQIPSDGVSPFNIIHIQWASSWWSIGHLMQIHWNWQSIKAWLMIEATQSQIETQQLQPIVNLTLFSLSVVFIPIPTAPDIFVQMLNFPGWISLLGVSHWKVKSVERIKSIHQIWYGGIFSCFIMWHFCSEWCHFVQMVALQTPVTVGYNF